MKKLSLLLAFIIAISTVIPSISYGENNYNKKLEENIVKAKKLFGISSDYDQFNSNINSYEKNTTFNLNWQDSSKKLNNINITMDIDGNIISFDSYPQIYKEPSRKLPKYTKEELEKKALDFIEKVSPDIRGSIKLQENKYPIYSNDTNYSFTFIRYVNDIKYNQNTVHISLDKYTGETTNYYVNWDRNIDFPKTNNVIKFDLAQEAFKEKIGLKLIYKSKMKYRPIDIGLEDSDYYIAYSPLYYNQGIDALTGEKVNIDYYSYGDKEMAADEGIGAAGLSPEEQGEVDKLKGLLDEEKAEDKMRQIDAKSGELLSYYKSISYNENEKPTIDKEKSLEIAKAYLSKQNPEKQGQLEFIENQYQQTIEETKMYNFQFIRKIDNAYVENDSVYVGVDAVKGEVYSYSVEWFKGEFPSKANVISLEKAYDILWKEIGLELMYIKSFDEKEDASKIKLVYALNSEKPPIISAVNGELLDYSGNPYSERQEISYSDIEESYAKDKIKTLAEYGVGFSEGKFLPNAEIKQSEYIYLLWKSNNQYRTDKPKEEDIYDEFIRMDYIEESEKAPNKIVTKAEAVKYLIRMMGLREVAEIKGIYGDIFKDGKSISEELKGYINIAFGLNIISGNGTGNINPEYKLKRQDAASIIYNYLFR